MWLNNTNGKKDAMLTFAALSFAVVTLNIFLSSFDTITFGDTSIIFKSLDSSVMAIYLGSTFTAYVSRRWTDRKYITQDSSPVSNVINTVVESVSSISEPAITSTPTSVETPPVEVALSQIEMQESLPVESDATAPISGRKRRTRS